MADRHLGTIVGGVGAVALAAVFGLAVLRAQTPPEGPVEPTWDRTACARCRMLIGDPSFAAQVHLESGEILHFDDPGCLLADASERKAEARSAWFHHSRRDSWLPIDEVAFASATPTPMGYGLAAVDADAPGSLDLAAARARVIARDRDRRSAQP